MKMISRVSVQSGYMHGYFGQRQCVIAAVSETVPAVVLWAQDPEAHS